MKKIFLLLIVSIALIQSCRIVGEKNENVFSKLYNTENLAKQSFSISSVKDTLLTGKSGTTIRISKNTFVDDKGNDVVGTIEIELREALTASEMVLANLNTTSNRQILQSGGMIYVNAMSSGKQIFIRKDNGIEIRVPTGNKLDDMQIYSAETDSATGQINWVNPQNLLANNFKLNLTLSDTTKFDTVPAQPLTAPEKPVKYDENDARIVSFSCDNQSNFPELKQFENVRFRVSEKSNYKPEDAKKYWVSVDMKKGATEGTYILTFTGYDNTGLIKKEYEVSPVYESSDYKTAIKDYEKKFDEYEIWKKKIASKQKLISENQERLEYVFNMSKLGWCNIDRYYNDSRMKEVQLVLNIKAKGEYSAITFSLIVKEDKVCIGGFLKDDGTFGASLLGDGPCKLPIGINASLLTTAYKDDKLFFSIQKFQVSEKQNLNLTLLETNSELIKKELEEKI